jgi:hypothetical protein
VSESQTQEEKKVTPRRRRWPWVLLVFFIGSILLLNGPGARLILEKTIPGQLESLGLSGDYQLTGQIHRGFTLTNIDLTGDKLIKKAKADRIAIDYLISEVISGKAQSVTIHGLDLVLNLDELSESKDEKEEPPVPLMETLNSVRKYIEPVKIDLQDINVRVEKEDLFATIAFESLTHESGASEFLLTGFKTESSETEPQTSPPCNLVWQLDLITLDQLDLIPDTGIRNLKLTSPSLLKTDILLVKSTFHASSDLEADHTLKLANSDFDLESIKHLLPEDLDISGRIATLDLNAKLPKDAPREISLTLNAENLKYQNNIITKLSANGKLGGVDATIALSADFEIPDTLSGTFSTNATGQLDPDIQQSLANLDWKLVTKEYPVVTGTAAWTDQRATLTATTLEKVKLLANFDPATQLYQTEVISELEDARALLPELTSAKLILKASGDLKNETHQGSLTLQDIRYTSVESPTIIAKGQAGWDWPTQFSFQDLEVKRDDLEIKTSLTWKEGFANFSKLVVADSQGSLLTGQGSFPLPLQTRNLDDLLENQSPLDFSVKLAPTPLSRFVKDMPIEGTAEVTLNFGGTFAKPAINGKITATKVRDPSLTDVPPGDLVVTLTTIDEQLHLSGKLTEPSGDLLDLKGRFPLTPEKWLKDADSLMDEPLAFTAHTPRIDLRRLQQFAATPLSSFVKDMPIEGTAQATLNISGTLAKPAIDGKITATKVRDPSLTDVPPCDLVVTLTTIDEQLRLSGKITEPSGDLLDLKGRFPLTPEKWSKDPDSLMDEPLAFTANTPRIDLRRLQRLAPTVSDLSGIAQINVKVAGTIREPDLSVDAMIRADRARLSNSPISDFRNSKINLKFNNNTITISPSQITAAGGTIDFSGSVTLGEIPLLDLSFRGVNTLLWRGADYSLRADPVLTLKGPFETARLTGTIPIVESIIYKDVEILPFGVPTKEIERPEVPDLSAFASDELYSLPEPFANWPIDVAIVTKDPILIRGNLVKGELLADARLGGTLGEITTSGKITSQNLKADLPFAKLIIENGTVDLNDKNLTDPSISVRGNSKVAGYNIQLYITGPVSKPAISITSEPPLPESEILMLLSTGSTTSTLNNRSVASQKALQYLLQGLRRRYGKQDAKGLLQRLLKNLDEVDLSLGDYNRFSGRHATSATIDISDQWAISTSIDGEGNGRNMVIFSFRFQ